jgi:hypothetical protein
LSFTLTSPITGSAQTGLTTPTYTHVVDTPPDITGKQVAISALGGTQTGVTVHSIAAPFTITVFRPKAFRSLGKANPVTGVIKDVPRNSFKVITRKGVTPLAGQPFTNLQITTIIDVPAGSDTADPANVRAALSAHLGALSQQSAGFGDTCVSGVL